jgi:hypothetical protein
MRTKTPSYFREFPRENIVVLARRSFLVGGFLMFGLLIQI